MGITCIKHGWRSAQGICPSCMEAEQFDDRERDRFLAGQPTHREQAGEREDVVTKDVNEQAIDVLVRQLTPVAEIRLSQGYVRNLLTAFVTQLNQQHAEAGGGPDAPATSYREAFLRGHAAGERAAASRHEAELVEVVRPFREALEQVEFEEMEYDGTTLYICPWCHSQTEEHKDHCVRQSALAILPADIRQRVAEREDALKLSVREAGIKSGTAFAIDDIQKGRSAHAGLTAALATHDLKVRQDFADWVIEFMNDAGMIVT